MRKWFLIAFTVHAFTVMADNDARIRLCDYRADDKLVRLHVGKACMEPLAIANRQGEQSVVSRRTFFYSSTQLLHTLSTATTHRITIAIWLAVASVLVNVMGWWPKAEIGWMGYLRPLPAYAVTFLPLAFAIDWSVLNPKSPSNCPS